MIGTRGPFPTYFNYMNAMTDFGANNCHADGSTDDSAHLNANIATAIAAGKTLYLPAGTYYLNNMLTPRSNMVMTGAGDTTILYMPDAATDYIHFYWSQNTTDVHIGSMFLDSDLHCSVSPVYGFVFWPGATSLRTTLSDITVDHLHTGVKTSEYSAGAIQHYNITCTNWKTPVGTASGIRQGWLCNGLDGLTVQNANIYAGDTEVRVSDKTHMFYLSTDVNNVLVEDCEFTLEYQMGVSISLYGAVEASRGSDFIFRRINMGNNNRITQTLGVVGAYTNVLFEDITDNGPENRGAVPHFQFYGDSLVNVKVKDCIFEQGYMGHSLVDAGGGPTYIENVTHTYCESQMGNPHPGLLDQGTVPPLHHNVAVGSGASTTLWSGDDY